jgi:transposase InsO family protein
MLRSLSRPGCTYDNKVAETTYKTFKTELCRKRFDTLEQLETELFECDNGYNTKRIHGSLAYLSTVEYRKQMSI